MLSASSAEPLAGFAFTDFIDRISGNDDGWSCIGWSSDGATVGGVVSVLAQKVKIQFSLTNAKLYAFGLFAHPADTTRL